MIGRIERLNLRDVWRHEAHNFTTWLEQNLDVLNEILDINLSNAEREKNAGSFNVDLVAEDENGNAVIIENQLEKSDHDHLGKVITYSSNIGAKTAIWVVSDPRSEHIKAVTWLNESTDSTFYLIKLEAIRISESDPAPLLTLIVGPSDEEKEVGKTKKDFAERHIIRKRFWTQLLEHSKTKTKLHSNLSPTPYNWIGTGSGVRGLGFNYGLTQHSATVELYIDRGKDCEKDNKSIFDDFFMHKDKIEQTFGDTLEWQSLEGKRACRICKPISLGGYKDENKWPKIHEVMVDTMIKFESAIKPYIKELKV